jgi:hypothetical protein
MARLIERNGASHRPYNLHAVDCNGRKTYSGSWAGRSRVAAQGRTLARTAHAGRWRVPLRPDAGAYRSGRTLARRPDAGAYRSGRTLARPIERNGASHRPYNLHAVDCNGRKTYSGSWAGRSRVAAQAGRSRVPLRPDAGAYRSGRTLARGRSLQRFYPEPASQFTFGKADGLILGIMLAEFCLDIRSQHFLRTVAHKTLGLQPNG